MIRVVLSVGSNVGDRLAHLQAAVDALREELAAVSPVYETAPFGTGPQRAYLNAVLVAEGARDAHAWLDRARDIEAAAGRERPRRWAPRTLDVDLITVGSSRSADPVLSLPHPRAHERAFVLVPWLDVEPDAVLPGVGRVRDILAGLDRSGVHPRADLVLR